jgi:hypothetical protein
MPTGTPAARAYMRGLSKDREVACELMLDQADIREFSRQLELAPFK